MNRITYNTKYLNKYAQFFYYSVKLMYVGDLMNLHDVIEQPIKDVIQWPTLIRPRKKTRLRQLRQTSNTLSESAYTIKLSLYLYMNAFQQGLKIQHIIDFHIKTCFLSRILLRPKFLSPLSFNSDQHLHKQQNIMHVAKYYWILNGWWRMIKFCLIYHTANRCFAKFWCK